MTDDDHGKRGLAAVDWLTARREACIAATDQAVADRRLAELVDAHVELDGDKLAGMTRAEVEARVREALAYYAGYYPSETRARVERLYRCAHPIFGPIAECGVPTTEQVLRAGRALGEATTTAERKRIVAELQAEAHTARGAYRRRARARPREPGIDMAQGDPGCRRERVHAGASVR